MVTSPHHQEAELCWREGAPLNQSDCSVSSFSDPGCCLFRLEKRRSSWKRTTNVTNRNSFHRLKSLMSSLSLPLSARTNATCVLHASESHPCRIIHIAAPPAPVIDPIWLLGGHTLMNTDAAFSPLDSSVPAGRSGRRYWRTGIETGEDMMRMTEAKTPNASAQHLMPL